MITQILLSVLSSFRIAIVLTLHICDCQHTELVPSHCKMFAMAPMEHSQKCRFRHLRLLVDPLSNLYVQLEGDYPIGMYVVLFVSRYCMLITMRWYLVLLRTNCVLVSFWKICWIFLSVAAVADSSFSLDIYDSRSVFAVAMLWRQCGGFEIRWGWYWRIYLFASRIQQWWFWDCEWQLECTSKGRECEYTQSWMTTRIWMSAFWVYYNIYLLLEYARWIAIINTPKTDTHRMYTMDISLLCCGAKKLGFKGFLDQHLTMWACLLLRVKCPKSMLTRTSAYALWHLDSTASCLLESLCDQVRYITVLLLTRIIYGQTLY